MQQQLQRTLTVSDEGGPRGLRLVEDAQRLWQRIRRFLTLNLTATQLDQDALELACYALQLPLRGAKPSAGRAGQLSLRERTEQAVELLMSQLAKANDPTLIDRATRILRDIPHKTPASEEARLLADALNLDDFGMTGLVLQAMQLARTNAGISQLSEGFEKRQAYGYWDARLKDGFHFAPVREMARQRIERARQAADLLKAELNEDQAP